MMKDRSKDILLGMKEAWVWDHFSSILGDADLRESNALVKKLHTQLSEDAIDIDMENNFAIVKISI